MRGGCIQELECEQERTIPLHPTRPGDQKMVAEPVINIRDDPFRATDPLNNEFLDISIREPLHFSKEDALSIGRPAGKVPQSERSLEGLQIPLC